jgi:CO dehydrogenase nickel-insertion accessory protein CooC1
VEQTGLELLGQVPDDLSMAEFEFTGRPLVELPAEAPVYQAVRHMAQKVLET